MTPDSLAIQKTLRSCNYIAATTDNNESLAKGLAPIYRDQNCVNQQWLRVYKLSGFCGDNSRVCIIGEEFLKEAKRIATELGIICDHAGIAGLAALLQCKDEVPKDKKILIVNTGKPKKI